jgi:hypothetical protein
MVAFFSASNQVGENDEKIAKAKQVKKDTTNN